MSKMKRQRNCSQLKEQEETLKKNDAETNNLSDKEFKALVIKMFTELWKIDTHSKTLTRN